MKMGFTGPRYGMTDQQRQVIAAGIDFAYPGVEVHHGDCLGADHTMDEIAKERGMRRVIHPPSDPKLRAWCEGDEILPERPYLDRNHDIVDGTDFLVAAPAEAFEPSTGGGTWYTIRYARERGKPVVIIWPDGTTTGQPTTTAKDTQ